MVNELG